MLRPGGIVRIVVPDLRHIVDRYINKEIQADRICEELRVFREQREKTVSINSYYVKLHSRISVCTIKKHFSRL